MLLLQPPQPPGLTGSAHLHLRLLGEHPEEPGVAVAPLPGLVALLEPFARVLAYGLSGIDSGHVRSLLGRLTPAEQAEVLRDHSPDGWAYSDRLRRVLTPREIAYALTGFRVDLVEQMHFLGTCLAGGWGWRRLTYGDVRPLILVFPVAECARLGTDEWLPVFLQLCDDVTIVDAVHDLDLPFAAQRAWVEAERSWL